MSQPQTDKKNLNLPSQIIGWEQIMPELAAFFTALKMRVKSKNDLTPFNLFLSGRPGTNKTHGILNLCERLGFNTGIIDCSTLDDVAELAGVIDIHANRQEGIAKLIEGELLNKDILILDEFLNARPHVVPQFRLMLQGKLVLLAKEVPMNVKCLIATANLSEDMDAGEANVLDSPTADRFAMLIRVPALRDLNVSEQDAIIEGRTGNGFEDKLSQIIKDATQKYGDVTDVQIHGSAITRYVRTVADHLSETPFSFEGRRAQLLRQFVFAAVSAVTEGDRVNGTVSCVMHACLSVPKLTGQELESNELIQAHQEGEVLLERGFLSEEELQILDANTVLEKIRIMIEHRGKLSLTTKIDACRAVMESDDIPLKLALIELLKSDLFSDEPAEFKEIANELHRTLAADHGRSLPEGYETTYEEYTDLSHSRPMALRCAEGNLELFKAYVDAVRSILCEWKEEER